MWDMIASGNSAMMVAAKYIGRGRTAIGQKMSGRQIWALCDPAYVLTASCEKDYAKEEQEF